MSRINSHQIISYLYRNNVSHAMIKILEEQRINDEDLQTIDRDDIEHLFKTEYGFTFRDRKQFWNAIQKFQIVNTKNEIVYIEQGVENHDIYNVLDDEQPNYQLPQHYMPIASSNIHPSVGIYNHPNVDIEENVLELSSTEEDNDDSVQTATTSLPVSDRFPQHHQSKLSSDVKFKFPVELPSFSSKVIRALETNDIESEWHTLIIELTQWVLNKKPTPVMKREYQAIGESLYKRYPCLGREGFRPWSHLCRCLTQRIRREKKKKYHNVFTDTDS